MRTDLRDALRIRAVLRATAGKGDMQEMQKLHQDLLVRKTDLMRDIENKRERRRQLMHMQQNPERDTIIKRLTEEIASRIKVLGSVEAEIEKLLENGSPESSGSHRSLFSYDPEESRPGITVFDSEEVSE